MFTVISVAPYMGAWIETFLLSEQEGHTLVAPYMGAWIETISNGSVFLAPRSHPIWVRGLKLCSTLWTYRLPQSHPIWVRGLKRQVA